MLASMKSMLNHASENNYAVMAVNCVNMETMKAVMDAAVEEKSPVIINVSPRQFKAHADLKMISAMYKSYAKYLDVPVALNLDHGSLFEDIVYSIKMGFTSVMFDGSTLPIDENIRRTKLIKMIADEYGSSIEAELGHVGSAMNGDNQTTEFYTTVDDARHFVDETGVDCLAVAIGTAHGKYPDGVIPKLDFNRLRELKEELKIPLVLHGGSGTAEKDIKQAVALGINKINVCTDVYHVGREAIKEALAENPTIDLMDLQHTAELKMKNYIKKYMRLIGSSNRCMYRELKEVNFD